MTTLSTHVLVPDALEDEDLLEAIESVLHRRAKFGHTVRLEVDASMTDGAVSWMTLALAARGAGEEVVRGDQRLAGRYACYRVYECSDGGFYSVGALEPKFWIALCAAIGRPDLAELQFAEGPDGEPVHRALEGVFASRSRRDW